MFCKEHFKRSKSTLINCWRLQISNASALVVKVAEAWIATKHVLEIPVGVPVENTCYWGDNDRERFVVTTVPRTDDTVGV
jgi:hypothetical protein